MRTLFIGLIMSATFASCGSLTSTTYIPPQQSFELGKNAHDPFSAKVKNRSNHPIELHRAPIEGGKHSFVTLKPGEEVKVKVESNTAVVFNNSSSDTAKIELVVHGDTGLGMQYTGRK